MCILITFQEGEMRKISILIITILVIIFIQQTTTIQADDITEQITILEKLLQNKNKAVRLNAIKKLNNIKDKRVLDTLIRALKNQDKHVRIYACRALGKLKHYKAVKPLVIVMRKDGKRSVKKRSNNCTWNHWRY